IEILHGHGRKIDIAAGAVKLLKVIESLPKHRLVEYLFRNQTQNGFDEILIEFLRTYDFHVADSVLIVFLDFEGDVVAIDFLLPERKRYSERKRRLQQWQRSRNHPWFGVDDRIQNIGPDISVVGIEDANTCDVISKFQIIVSVLAGEHRQRAGFLGQLHR